MTSQLDEIEREDWGFHLIGKEEGISVVDRFDSIPSFPLRLLAISNASDAFVAGGPSHIVFGKLSKLRESIRNGSDFEGAKIKHEGALIIEMLGNETQVVVYDTDSMLTVYSISGFKTFEIHIPYLTDLRARPKSCEFTYIQDGTAYLCSDKIDQLGEARFIAWDDDGSEYALVQSSKIVRVSMDSDLNESISLPENRATQHISFVGNTLLLACQYEDQSEVYLYQNSWILIPDACPPFGDAQRTPVWYTEALTHWSVEFPLVILAAAGQSSDILLASDSHIIKPMEGHQACLPFTDADTTPIGASLDLGGEFDISNPLTGIDRSPPQPLWMVLNNEGKIIEWSLVSREIIDRHIPRPQFAQSLNFTADLSGLKRFFESHSKSSMTKATTGSSDGNKVIQTAFGEVKTTFSSSWNRDKQNLQASDAAPVFSFGGSNLNAEFNAYKDKDIKSGIFSAPEKSASKNISNNGFSAFTKNISPFKAASTTSSTVSGVSPDFLDNNSYKESLRSRENPKIKNGNSIFNSLSHKTVIDAAALRTAKLNPQGSLSSDQECMKHDELLRGSSVLRVSGPIETQMSTTRLGDSDERDNRLVEAATQMDDAKELAGIFAKGLSIQNETLSKEVLASRCLQANQSGRNSKPTDKPDLESLEILQLRKKVNQLSLQKNEAEKRAEAAEAKLQEVNKPHLSLQSTSWDDQNKRGETDILARFYEKYSHFDQTVNANMSSGFEEFPDFHSSEFGALDETYIQTNLTFQVLDHNLSILEESGNPEASAYIKRSTPVSFWSQQKEKLLNNIGKISIMAKQQSLSNADMKECENVTAEVSDLFHTLSDVIARFEVVQRETSLEAFRLREMPLKAASLRESLRKKFIKIEGMLDDLRQLLYRAKAFEKSRTFTLLDLAIIINGLDTKTSQLMLFYEKLNISEANKDSNSSRAGSFIMDCSYSASCEDAFLQRYSLRDRLSSVGKYLKSRDAAQVMRLS